MAITCSWNNIREFALHWLGRNLSRTSRALIVCLFLAAIPGAPLRAQQGPPTQAAQPFRFSIDRRTGEFALQATSRHTTLLRGQMGAKVNGRWLYADNYPRHSITSSAFRDLLGSGQEILIHNQGLKGQPELQEILQTYDHHPYVTIQAKVVNHTNQTVLVSDLRSLDATGKPILNLGAANSYDRVLSGGFSEWGTRLSSLGMAPSLANVHGPQMSEYIKSHPSMRKVLSDYLHLARFAVGSQLIYNRRSHYGIFFGALTTTRFITIYDLGASPPSAGSPARILSFAADSTGTTVIQDYHSLQNDPLQDHITLRLPVQPGGDLPAERIMVGGGGDFLKLLENYGQAVRLWHHVDITMPAPMGWWSSDGTYHNGLDSGAALTNAAWLSQHVRRDGFRYFFMDDGYQYDRGEYTTPNAILFPHGVGYFGRRVALLGLKFGLWTAPLDVAQHSRLYQLHPDWLVHNAAGQPIEVQNLGHFNGGNAPSDPVYVLDTTDPGAQLYLWRTFRTLTHDWGARLIKLDFMATSSIEGFHYRPHTTAMEDQRIGLEIIRRAVGPNVFIDKDGSTMLNPVGLVDGGRLSDDVGRGFGTCRREAIGIAARFYMDRNFYISDPDSFAPITKQSVPASPPPYGGLRRQNENQLATRNIARVAITIAAVTGGMYEIGGDLPVLAREPYRLALVLNPDLLDMVRVGRAALPLDLMTYRRRDGQPSIFFLREDARQAMLAVFDWTQKPLTHQIKLTQLGLGPGFQAEDVFNHDQPVALQAGNLVLAVPAQDVRVIKFVDKKLPPAPPIVHVQGPTQLTVGREGDFYAQPSPDGDPVMRWRWNFGDGVTGDGPAVQHAYTMDGVFPVTVQALGLDGPATVHRLQVSVSGTFDLRLHIGPTRDRRWLPPAPPGIKGP
ncbi:MAG: PKD domain-containing protein [Terriglobia bacterium]